MSRYLTAHIMRTCLVVGMVFGPGVPHAEPTELAEKTPQSDRSVSPDPFTPSPDIADLIRLNATRPTATRVPHHEQLTGDFWRIEGPTGWWPDFDPKNKTTNYFPLNLPKELFVNVTVYPKLQSVDPNETQTLPVQFRGQLVTELMDVCQRSEGHTEGATPSEYWGPIVHSTFVCVDQDGKRYTETLFTIKSTTQKQLMVLMSDESIHESQLPTVRAMLKPLMDRPASIDHAGAGASIVPVVPGRQPASPQMAVSQSSTSMSQEELIRYLTEEQRIKHETMMSIIRSMGPQWRECDVFRRCYRY